MTATVTSLSSRHSWDKRPRMDDASRHIYTCRRDTCGLMVRSELVDGEWLKFWRWPDRTEGQGKKAPSCGDHPAAASTLTAVAQPGEPAVELAPTAPPANPCCCCQPPCGLPTRLYLGGRLCKPQADAAARARQGGAA